MFDYTKAAIDKIKSDFRRFGFVYSIIVQLIYIAYLAYALATSKAIFWANVSLATICVAYFIFYVTTYGKIDKNMKNAKKSVRRAQKYTRLGIKAFTLGTTIYSVYYTALSVTVLSVVLSSLMLVGWILQVIFEIVRYIFESRVDLFLAGLNADVEKITKPITTVKNIFSFKRKDSDESLKKPSKARLILDKKVEITKSLKKSKKSKKD